VFVVARGERRAIGGAVCGVAVAATLSLLVSGTSGVAGFVGALGGALANTPPPSTVGLAGLVSSWTGSGPSTVALVLSGSLVALAAAAVLGVRSRRRDRLEWALGGAVALSLLVAPHLLTHDLVLLAPPLVWCTARAVRRGATDATASGWAWPALAWMALAALVALDAGNGAQAPPGRVVPWGLIAGGAAALLALRQRPHLAAAGSAATSAAQQDGVTRQAKSGRIDVGAVRPRRAS
jgi:hypothetical protein